MRILNKKKMKEMKSDVDENNESGLSKFLKWSKRQQQNKRFLKREERAYNAHDINETVHDHNIVSKNEIGEMTKLPLDNKERTFSTTKSGLGGLQR